MPKVFRYYYGTKAGGLKAAITNKAKHGENFYAEIGRRGGKNGHTGGFAANRELAKLAGSKGGTISRRNKGEPYYMSLTERRIKYEVEHPNNLFSGRK